MSRRPGHPVNRGVRRALAARRMERARYYARQRAARVLYARTWPDDTRRDVCEMCGRVVTTTAEAHARGAFIACDCGGGLVVACRHCARGGYGSDPLLCDPPYVAGGIAGPLAGPEWPLPGGARAALLGTVALARSLGGAR